VFALVFFLIGSPGMSYAQVYSTGAYGEYDKKSFTEKISDWYATLGVSEKRKRQVLNRRRAQRKIKKAKKATERRKREILKQKQRLKNN